jgi:hypothetical protein
MCPILSDTGRPRVESQLLPHGCFGSRAGARADDPPETYASKSRARGRLLLSRLEPGAVVASPGRFLAVPRRPKRYDVLARAELAPVPCRLLFAWECGHGVVVDRAAVTRLWLGSCGALGFTRCKFAGACCGCPSKGRSGHPCSDRPSERGRCGARLLLHWLGADPVPERALVIERDGGRRHQLVIACRL